MTHPGAEEIAEHLEGLLDVGADDRVRAHLRTCADCARTARDLAEVPQALRDATAPIPPMPAALAGRVEDALGAEAAQRATSQLDARRRQRRRRVAGGLLAAAAVAVVAVGVGEVLQGARFGAGGGGSAGSVVQAPAESGAGAPDRGLTAESGRPSSAASAPDAQDAPEAPDAGSGLVRSPKGQRALIVDAVARRHVPGDDRRDRARCVRTALETREPAASYSVTLPGGRGGTRAVVALRPAAAPTQGLLIACEPRPRVLLRRDLQP